MKGNSDHTRGLPRRWEQMLTALLSHGAVAEAARAAGVSETSIWRALQNTSFQTHYRNARRQIVENAIGHLQSTTVDAVRTLRSIVNDTNAPSSARVTAARAILEHSVKAVEIQDLETRIYQLEELLNESTKRARKWG